MSPMVHSGNDKQKMKRIGRKVGNLVAVMLGVSITLVVILCVLMFYRLTMSMMQNECVSGTNVLAYELSSYSGDEDKTELLDALKQEMGCEFTIFQGDERAYTTIQQNGQRAVGTRLSADIAKIVLEQGKSYVGQATILGEKHLCSYVPTYDASGQINGLIFAGISMSSAVRQIGLTVALSFLAGVVLISIGILIIGAYIKRTVSNPLSQLTALAQTLEQGDLGLNRDQTVITEMDSNDEIGILSKSFHNTIGRLRNYIGEISDMLEAIAGGDLTAQITQEYVGDFAAIRTSLNDILHGGTDCFQRGACIRRSGADVYRLSGAQPGVHGADRCRRGTGGNYPFCCGQRQADGRKRPECQGSGRRYGQPACRRKSKDAGNDHCYGGDHR